MELLSWIFDGIGTQIIGIIIGLIFGGLTGGAIGYKIGVKNKIVQRQTGGNGFQIQIGNTNFVKEEDKNGKHKTNTKSR